MFMLTETSPSSQVEKKPRRKFRVMTERDELKQSQEAGLILKRASQWVEIQDIKEAYKHDIFFSAHKDSLIKDAKARHKDENDQLKALHKGQWLYLEHRLNPYAFPFPTISEENPFTEEPKEE